jgi:hypothetical protein
LLLLQSLVGSACSPVVVVEMETEDGVMTRGGRR